MDKRPGEIKSDLAQEVLEYVKKSLPIREPLKLVIQLMLLRISPKKSPEMWEVAWAAYRRLDDFDPTAFADNLRRENEQLRLGNEALRRSNEALRRSNVIIERELAKARRVINAREYLAPSPDQPSTESDQSKIARSEALDRSDQIRLEAEERRKYQGDQPYPEAKTVWLHPSNAVEIQSVLKIACNLARDPTVCGDYRRFVLRVRLALESLTRSFQRESEGE